MKTTGKTWKDVEEIATDLGGWNLWSQPYVPHRHKEDHVKEFKSYTVTIQHTIHNRVGT